MSECNNIVDVSALEQCSEIDNDSYLIVQKIDSVCRAKISDLVLGAENVNFYPELIEILNKLNSIITDISPLTAGWQQTKQTVDTNKPLWDSYNESPLTGLEDNIKDNIDDWNATTQKVQTYSDDWINTTNSLGLSSGVWNDTANVVSIKTQNWDDAYTISLTVEAAAAEALRVIEGAYTSNMLSVYTTVYDNSGDWNQ